MSDGTSEYPEFPMLGATVIYDPDIEACVTISAVLDADLWSKEDGPPPQTVRSVAIVDTAAKADEILQWVQQGLHRPALVVGWDLPEHAVSMLLDERIPVLDGRIVDDPQLAADALRGMWSSQRFADESTYAMKLASLEAKLGIS